MLSLRILILATCCYLSRTFISSFHRSSIWKFPSLKSLSVSDEEVFNLIKAESNRQFEGIELIASENFVSQAVLDALGSCMTNKYSEGLPNARYYGGNQYVDQLEILCQTRALELFKLNNSEWKVNVQPYSGSPANLAVYTALLQPHDRLMGLDLPSGGHLTHGFQTPKRKVSASALFFESLSYRVHPITGRIDYEDLAQLAVRYQPKLIIAGGSAYPRDWDYARMRMIADSVGAYLMADIAHVAGLVACGVNANPFPYCDIVTTTTHKSLRGPRSALIFARSHLSNKINQAVFPGLQGGPHNHQIAAVCVALKEACHPAFQQYIEQVQHNAITLATVLQTQYGYTIATNGTDNHLVLWDLRTTFRNNCTTGSAAAVMEKLLEYCGISVNKNCVPGDKSALYPSGIRLGTLAMTTRGMLSEDMVSIADYLHRVCQLAQQLLSCNSSNHDGMTTIVGNKKKSADDTMHSLLQSQSTSSDDDDTEAERVWKIKQQLDAIKAEVRAFAIKFPMPANLVK